MSRTQRGIALIYLMLALALLAIMGIVALANYTLETTSRQADASVSVEAAYQAITGIPNTDNFGYLGDVGDYPSSLQDLLVAPANVSGWNGPYLKNVRANSSVLLDVYGSPLQYFLSLGSAGSLDQIAIASAGPDLSSSNSSGNTSTSTSPLPGSTGPSGYASGSGNTDNVIYPGTVSNPVAITRQNAGTLEVFITNFDVNANVASYQPGCPGFYTVTITSVTRGTADTMSLQYPESPTPTSSSPLSVSNPGVVVTLGQGAYLVSVTSALKTGPVFSDTVNIEAGATVIKNVVVPPIDSSQMGTFSLTIYNQASNNLKLFTNGAGGSQGNVSKGTNTLNNIHYCTPYTVNNGNSPSTTNAYDAFIVPYNISGYIRYVDNVQVTLPDASPPHDLQPTISITITNGGTQSDQVMLFQTTAPGTFLGSVYKRKQGVIAVNKNSGANIGTAGVQFTLKKKDGVTNVTGTTNPVTVTANSSITVP